MKTKNIPSSKPKKDNEKGAALVMALLVTFLLLVASAGVLLETTTNTNNVTDSVSEQQAYQAAESGIQAAVDVLRDNVTLPDNRLIDPNPAGCGTAPQLCKANRINYLKALDVDASNIDVGNDPNDNIPRLSRWLRYAAAGTERVAIGSGTYVAQNGYAYSLDISDPDHTGSLVTYSSKGKLGDNDATPLNASLNNQKTYSGASANDKIVVKFNPQAAIQIDTVGGVTNANFGAFSVTKSGNGACILNYNRLQIEVTMTQPYYGLRVIRGYVRPNAAACDQASYATPDVRFDSITFTLQGSLINLVSTGGNAVSTTWAPDPPVDGVPSGFNSQLIASTGSEALSTLAGTMTSPEPIRLTIKSTGYGPRGATKQLEAIIQKNFFNGLTAPATLTLIGPPSTTATAACPTCTPAAPAQPASNFLFALGNSNAMLYSGQDAASTDIIPPIGAWGDTNVGAIFDEVDDVNRWNRIVGIPSDITSDTPPWLSSPQGLDNYIKMQAASAGSRYFPSGVEPGKDNFGNPNGTGLTICDGDCTFTGDGGGILIVTGKLTLHGDFSFKGIILVTGQGGVDRRGAGQGTIEGNMIIAPYVNSSILPSSEPVGAGFLSPQYDMSGGGASTIQYNSTALTNSLVAVSNFVLGVLER